MNEQQQARAWRTFLRAVEADLILFTAVLVTLVWFGAK